MQAAAAIDRFMKRECISLEVLHQTPAEGLQPPGGTFTLPRDEPRNAMDGCGTRRNESAPAFRGHHLRARRCPRGPRVVSAPGFAKVDPASCRLPRRIGDGEKLPREFPHRNDSSPEIIRITEMSEEPIRLEEQIRRAFEGEAWYGPGVLEALADVSCEAAAAHPIPGAHSIWEIVLHLAATYRLVLRRVDGVPGSLSAELDWPSILAVDAERWREGLEELRRLNRDVRQAVLAFGSERLDQELAAGHSSAYMHFSGLAQHDAYHAGQIILLRKAMQLSGTDRKA